MKPARQICLAGFLWLINYFRQAERRVFYFSSRSNAGNISRMSFSSRAVKKLPSWVPASPVAMPFFIAGAANGCAAIRTPASTPAISNASAAAQCPAMIFFSPAKRRITSIMSVLYCLSAFCPNTGIASPQAKMSASKSPVRSFSSATVPFAVRGIPELVFMSREGAAANTSYPTPFS